MSDTSEIETIEFEGETYEISYKPIIECEHCGNQWATSSDARRPSCSSPGCRRKTDRNVVGKYYEDIIRYNLLDFTPDGPDVAGETVVYALRERANRYDAMLSNGWRLLGTGGQSSVWFIKGDVEMEAPVE